MAPRIPGTPQVIATAPLQLLQGLRDPSGKTEAKKPQAQGNGHSRVRQSMWSSEWRKVCTRIVGRPPFFSAPQAAAPHLCHRTHAADGEQTLTRGSRLQKLFAVFNWLFFF